MLPSHLEPFALQQTLERSNLGSYTFPNQTSNCEFKEQALSNTRFQHRRGLQIIHQGKWGIPQALTSTVYRKTWALIRENGNEPKRVPSRPLIRRAGVQKGTRELCIVKHESTCARSATKSLQSPHREKLDSKSLGSYFWDAVFLWTQGCLLLWDTICYATRWTFVMFCKMWIMHYDTLNKLCIIMLFWIPVLIVLHWNRCKHRHRKSRVMVVLHCQTVSKKSDYCGQETQN